MYKNFIKGKLDILGAILFLPIFLIILIPVSILIKLDSKGPIFYQGERVGKNLKKYKMFKFRSMVVNAPDVRNEDGSTYNEVNDSRQTRVGRILRKTSIDELPQILNVLNGDMSFVGPRPSPTGNEELYDENYLEKFSVKPGITGFTQAYFRNNASIKERQRNDLFYINNLSFLLDVKILLKTLKTVFKREGLYTNKSNK